MSVVIRTGLSLPIMDARMGRTDSGTCYSFNGSTGKITELCTPTLAASDSVSICGRIKLLADSTNSLDSQPILNTKWARIHIRLISAVHTLLIRMDQGSAIQAGVAINKSQWYNFVATMNSFTDSTATLKTVLKMYVNGLLVSAVETNGVPLTAFTEGVGTNGAGFFNGEMDDLQVYTRILSAKEAMMYHRNRIINKTNQVLFYKANEASGSIAVDSSPVGNNGTIIGGVTRVTDKVFNYP